MEASEVSYSAGGTCTPLWVDTLKLVLHSHPEKQFDFGNRRGSVVPHTHDCPHSADLFLCHSPQNFPAEIAG
jgi:hypothetical protein